MTSYVQHHSVQNKISKIYSSCKAIISENVVSNLVYGRNNCKINCTEEFIFCRFDKTKSFGVMENIFLFN